MRDPRLHPNDLHYLPSQKSILKTHRKSIEEQHESLLINQLLQLREAVSNDRIVDDIKDNILSSSGLIDCLNSEQQQQQHYQSSRSKSQLEKERSSKRREEIERRPRYIPPISIDSLSNYRYNDSDDEDEDDEESQSLIKSTTSTTVNTEQQQSCATNSHYYQSKPSYHLSGINSYYQRDPSNDNDDINDEERRSLIDNSTYTSKS